MKATFSVFPLLIVGLMVASACNKQGVLSPQVTEALALARRIREQTGRGGEAAAFATLLAPRARHRSPDTLDPTPLVVEDDVIAILKQRSACGDDTEVAVWKVTKEKIERPECKGTGTGVTACKVHWSGARPGEQYGAQGNFLLTVVDVDTFEMFRSAEISRPLPGVGDAAYLIQGEPYVRVGDLAFTIENSSSSSGLSIDVLKAVARRMPK
jgi:hypothetical protein